MPVILTPEIGPRTLPQGPIKRIHMIGANIRANKKDGGTRPIMTVRFKGRAYHCGSFWSQGEVWSKVGFKKRLASGAVVWLETQAQVILCPMTGA